jgi:protein involved in polysaccharide export with SLBB domain
LGHYCDTRKEKLPILTVVVFSIGALLLGCQSSSYNSGMFEAEATLPRKASKEEAMHPPHVALVPGDVLEVKFFYTPDLNESQTVRPDGKIALQLVGEVKVEGKSPAVLRDELLELYTPHLKMPEIAIVIRSFYDRRVFVGGQVMAPGIVEMPGRMTLLEAIIQAGGFNVREAEVRNVVVIRHRNNQRYGYSVNLKPALTGDKAEPFYLKPKDIVYVPQTSIAKLGQWIDQHINKIIPDTGFHISKIRGDTIIGMGSYR